MRGGLLVGTTAAQPTGAAAAKAPGYRHTLASNLSCLARRRCSSA
jgi:hypothetical protein